MEKSVYLGRFRFNIYFFLEYSWFTKFKMV